MRRIFYILGCLIFLGGPILWAQDYEWWNKIHQWDGSTPWTRYLKMSPSFLGPNALPVPEIKNGTIAPGTTLETAVDGHYNKGDQTINLFTELSVPLFTPRVALKVTYVPVEWYRTDTVTRDLRASREYDGTGSVLGDFYVSTFVHLIKEHGWIPDVLLTANVKTASGTGLDAARNTDSPGYFFDASAGKRFFPFRNRQNYLKIYAMAGFYSYQTFEENHYQNDAFLYGTGIDFHSDNVIFENQIGGYSGYLEIGDRPVVYRMILTWTGNTIVNLRIRFQQGIQDFPFTSVRISTVWKIPYELK